MNAITNLPAINQGELIEVLRNSLYPGASDGSIGMALSYCKASGLDPMQKPVHIVPMWDSKAGQMRDVIMPGINLYRTQAARSNECAGVSEPEFGPDVTEEIGGQTITFPLWCRVSVKRRLPTGEIAEFSAKEFWRENYAVKGGKERSVAPNTMWTKRPYGQLAKCAEAQALRKAFPELAGAPTAEEMEGKQIMADDVIEHVVMPKAKAREEKIVDAEVVPIKGEPTDELSSADIERVAKVEHERVAASVAAGTITASMQRVLRKKLEGKDEAAFVATFGVESLDQIPAGRINEALSRASA